VDYTDIPSGAFSGTVVAVSSYNPANGSSTAIAPSISFSGTANNLQPLPVSVTVAYA
jgi:hypothetical protein